MIVDHRAAFFADAKEYLSMEETPLGQLRKQAWARLEEIGLPDRRSEAYRYFPSHLLYNEHFPKAEKAQLTPRDVKRLVMPECQESYVVFVNGQVDFELSCLEGVEGACIVRTFDDAMRSYSAFLGGRLSEQTQKEGDPFALLHMALYHEGLFIYLPPKTSLDAPIQIINISVNRNQSIMTLPKVEIFSGKETVAEVIATHHALGTESLFTHLYIDAVVEQNAKLKISQITSDPNIRWGFSTMRASVKAEACFEGLHIASALGHRRFDYGIDLLGEKASADLKGACLGKERNSIHTEVNLRHQAPSTRSSQLFKGALKEESVSAFSGKIFVDSIAQQTDAFQLCQHLLLDASAKAYAKPGLEIYADDVKASHGATCGPLEREPQFYLQSRGIDQLSIDRFLVRAHFKEFFEAIAEESLERLFINELEAYCV